MIDHMALPPQQDMKTAIAEPAPLMRHGLHPLAQDAVIRAGRRVANRHPATVDHIAPLRRSFHRASHDGAFDLLRPPLAHLEG